MFDLRKVGPVLFGLILLSACGPPAQTVDDEVLISELQAQVMDLQATLDSAYTEVSRLSTQLSTNVGTLEGAIVDLDRRVLNLRGSDPQLAIPEVEAAVGLSKQRLLEVKATSAELAAYLQ